MNKQELKAQALQTVCACYYYDLANCIDEMTATDLKTIINTPFYSHVLNNDTLEDLQDCPEYVTEQAEAIRDCLREDGINA